MTSKIYHSNSESATIKTATDFAKTLVNGDIVCFYGNLGAGKSVFARAVIRALCKDIELVVPSPTFTLVQMYDAPDYPVWHFDLYRLEDEQEIYEIGWEEALGDGIVLVEWPVRLGALMPKKTKNVRIKIEVGEDDHRVIAIDG